MENIFLKPFRSRRLIPSCRTCPPYHRRTRPSPPSTRSS